MSGRSATPAIKTRCAQIGGWVAVLLSGWVVVAGAGLAGALCEPGGGKNKGPFCPQADSSKPVANMAVTVTDRLVPGRKPRIPEILIMMAL